MQLQKKVVIKGATTNRCIQLTIEANTNYYSIRFYKQIMRQISSQITRRNVEQYRQQDNRTKRANRHFHSFVTPTEWMAKLSLLQRGKEIEKKKEGLKITIDSHIECKSQNQSHSHLAVVVFKYLEGLSALKMIFHFQKYNDKQPLHSSRCLGL